MTDKASICGSGAAGKFRLNRAWASLVSQTVTRLPTMR